MLRMGSWLTTKQRKASSQSLNSLDELQQLEDAMRAATHIINDDVEAAEEGLSRGNSAFHKLGRGVVTFIKATLGFEQDIMREASERLADAEATAYNDQRRAQREPRSYHSSIYPPGSEFALCQAQSQLMSALVGVLNESLSESLKGFYKLRKAYMTLSGILDAESKFLRDGSQGRPNGSNTSLQESTLHKPVALAKNVKADSMETKESAHTDAYPGHLNLKEAGNGKVLSVSQQEDEEDKFYDVSETSKEVKMAEEHVREPSSAALDEQAVKLNLGTEDNQLSRSASGGLSLKQQTSGEQINSELFEHPIDYFIHSGSNLCFGILLVMLSMIPPAFGKLLSIIGFRGDRERGLSMLWQASKLSNINGAIAGLILLGFYNGIVGFCDILSDGSDERIEGYPRRRCEELLMHMRKQYPKSRLWLLEEARLHAASRRLEEAVGLLDGDLKSQLVQVEALATFEKGLNSMYLHRYEMTSDGFLRCVELNSWSHALYYYIAGAAQVQLYRKLVKVDPEKAAQHAKVGTELLKKVPAHIGKKRFMARPLPFDTFVSRKIRKWEHRALEWGVDLIDAIGLSPIEEMIYLWTFITDIEADHLLETDGYKRMQPLQLQDSLDALSWSESSDNPHWHREGIDERAILALLRGTITRNLERYEDARRIMQEEILNHERHEFKGYLKDDWTCPSAHYEMAVICWMERKKPASKEGEAKCLKECAEWLEKAARWDSYDMDARIGLKITTAQDTLKHYNQHQAS